MGLVPPTWGTIQGVVGRCILVPCKIFVKRPRLKLLLAAYPAIISSIKSASSACVGETVGLSAGGLSVDSLDDDAYSGCSCRACCFLLRNRSDRFGGSMAQMKRINAAAVAGFRLI